MAKTGLTKPKLFTGDAQINNDIVSGVIGFGVGVGGVLIAQSLIDAQNHCRHRRDAPQPRFIGGLGGGLGGGLFGGGGQKPCYPPVYAPAYPPPYPPPYYPPPPQYPPPQQYPPQQYAAPQYQAPQYQPPQYQAPQYQPPNRSNSYNAPSSGYNSPSSGYNAPGTHGGRSADAGASSNVKFSSGFESENLRAVVIGSSDPDVDSDSGSSSSSSGSDSSNVFRIANSRGRSNAEDSRV